MPVPPTVFLVSLRLYFVCPYSVYIGLWNTSIIQEKARPHWQARARSRGQRKEQSYYCGDVHQSLSFFFRRKIEPDMPAGVRQVKDQLKDKFESSENLFITPDVP